MAQKPKSIEVGQIWCEKESGRLIKILEKEVHGTGPAWTYCTARGKPEADGPDHPDWFWHYCDVFDFFVWGRFEFVRQGKP